MSISDSIGLFFGVKEKQSLSSDSTLYKIETNPHEYIGRIIYQDDTVIKFQKEFGARLIKILKSNIRCISIVHVDPLQS
ncbi:MAG: hypothetical protein HY015_00490 [Bacteroidetes bacterium]|nr:hypothetical protein [Bacteroidota bacterium]MBI3481455.1 hypothetical protein [Bacteroidota bacterium]